MEISGPTVQENQASAAQWSLMYMYTYMYKEGSSALKRANTKGGKALKSPGALLKDSLEKCVMQAAALRTDKVPQFLLCVGG